MGFFEEAVDILAVLVRALSGVPGSMYVFYGKRRQPGKPLRPAFSKTIVRVRKHMRPPIRAQPGRTAQI